MSDLRATLVAIQELHKQIRAGEPREGECAGCSDPGDDGFDYCCGEHYWPCATRRLADEALEGDDRG